jgi:hypothetical protein
LEVINELGIPPASPEGIIDIEGRSTSMRSAMVVVCICLFLGVTTATAQILAELPVETVNEKEGFVTGLKAGNFIKITKDDEIVAGADSHGNPSFVEQKYAAAFFESSMVKFVVNDGFGFRFKLPKIEQGDKLLIEAVIKLPQFVPKGDGKDEYFVRRTYEFTDKDSESVQRIYWKFSKERPEYHLSGTWIFEIYNRGIQLAVNNFYVAM